MLPIACPYSIGEVAYSAETTCACLVLCRFEVGFSAKQSRRRGVGGVAREAALLRKVATNKSAALLTGEAQLNAVKLSGLCVCVCVRACTCACAWGGGTSQLHCNREAHIHRLAGCQGRERLAVGVREGLGVGVGEGVWGVEQIIQLVLPGQQPS